MASLSRGSLANRRRSINDIVLPPDLMKGMSIETLKEITKQDEATFYQYFEGLNLPEVKKIRKESNEIREANKALAIKNVEQAPKFNELKADLMLKAAELLSLREEYDKKYRELRELQSKVTPQSVQKELAEATKAIERESEDLASDFVAGKSTLNLEEFQEKFVEQRKVYWLRKVKTEKMKELLLNYRPTPAPRTTFHKSSSDNQVASTPSNPPYPSPAHSLPSQHMHSGGYHQNPSASVRPPYPPGSSMPMPSGPSTHPFPAAAYTPYSSVPPQRPPAYAAGPNRYNQHRY